MLATISHSIRPVDVVYNGQTIKFLGIVLNSTVWDSDQKWKQHKQMATIQGKRAHMQACIKVNSVQNSVNINIVHALQKSNHNEILYWNNLCIQSPLIVNFIQLIQEAYKHDCHQKILDSYISRQSY